MGISAILIACNEVGRIGKALDSVSWCDEQIVVDGGSADETVDICKGKGAKVYQRRFDNFADQKNYALSLAQQEWVLSLDADETVSPELKQEIISTVISPNNRCDGYYLKRRNYFLGKVLRFGGQGNEPVLRLFRKRYGKFQGIVHERVMIEGIVGELKNSLEHTSTQTLEEYYAKLRLYTDLDAQRMISDGKLPSVARFVLYPFAKWFVNYVLCGGFLDGRRGFLYHALSCYYGWLKNFKARSRMKSEIKDTEHEDWN
jgi:glycosyltransferase involved in cell wall biosynthesis